MTREIKFRFWNGKKMDYSPETHTGWLNDNFSPDLEDDGTWAYMQFTGLLDKNKKEIYEGDIVRIKSLLRRNNSGYHLTGEFAIGFEDFVNYEVYFDEKLCGYSLRSNKQFKHLVKENTFSGRQSKLNKSSVAYKNFYEPLSNVLGGEVIGNIYENPELILNPPR